MELVAIRAKEERRENDGGGGGLRKKEREDDTGVSEPGPAAYGAALKAAIIATYLAN